MVMIPPTQRRLSVSGYATAVPKHAQPFQTSSTSSHLGNLFQDVLCNAPALKASLSSSPTEDHGDDDAHDALHDEYVLHDEYDYNEYSKEVAGNYPARAVSACIAP